MNEHPEQQRYNGGKEQLKENERSWVRIGPFRCCYAMRCDAEEKERAKMNIPKKRKKRRRAQREMSLER